MARFFAVAMSHAPGLFGTPVCGQRAFGHEPFSTGDPHPFALTAGLKVFTGQQDSGPCQFLVEPAHRRL